MTRTCFGDLGGVKSCWGYRLKLVHSQQERAKYDVKSKHKLPHNVRQFSLKELQKATNNFSSLTGKGAFSSYYKGTLEDGTAVAIMVPTVGKENQEHESNSTTLIDIMSRIRHRNVVEFIGCCLDGDRRIMVYEFAGDNSLDQLLFVRNFEAKQSPLSWSRRASICIGIARGLEYLHEGMTHRVVHRDIKPSNVVLDSNFNPKIVDFGIGQLFDDDVSHYSGSIAGTLGYLDPEYYLQGSFTEKADVYSFGIVLLEVISGRKVTEFQRHDSGVTLLSWVWELRETDRVLEIVDPTLYDFPEDEVKRYIDVALSCVQPSSNLRPSMSEALLMLLGPYDFSKKVLRNPERSFWSGDHDEVNFPSHDKRSGQAEITAASSDTASSAHASGRKQDFPVDGSTFTRVPRQPAIESMNKMTHGSEIELERDLDAYSSASELVEISHDLESELFRSIEANIYGAASASKPSGENAVKPAHITPSSSSTRIDNPSSLSNDIHVDEKVVEAAEHREMSYGADTELQLRESSMSEFLGNTAVRADLRTTSAETDSAVQNEAVGKISFEAEISETGELLSLTKVGIKRTTTSGEIDRSVQNESIDWIPFHVEKNKTDEVLPLAKVDVKRPIRHTVEKILEVFKDAHHRRICLHGRAGSGKTTVLNNLFLHPAAKEMFDQILYVTVPRFSVQKHVRDEIVRQLSLNMQEACTDEESFSLMHQAPVDKKFLVLLDDVWESINLHEVGIPNPGPESSCWFIMATRSLDVCHAMTDMEIEMEVLSNAEAWQLFCCQVGDIIDSPEIKPYAQAISKECYGSPVIISAMGSALKAESNVEEWKLALKNLQLRNTVKTNDQCYFRWHIKYCYDRLKAHDMKTCFLYTALFQGEKEIDSSALVDSFISEGLVGGRTAAAYRKGHDIVRHLAKAFLLEGINDNGTMVKMHNVVRDSALEIFSSDIEGYGVSGRLPELETDDQSFLENSWITKLVGNTSKLIIQLPSNDKYLTRAGAHLKEPPSIDEWEQATMIFLMDNELSSLPSKPNCSILVTLLLQRNSCLRVIPASFFDTMANLRILNLSKTRIKSLPDSVSKLKSLQILLLRDCERLMLLPTSIGILKHLEVLDLQGTEVTHLPDSVGELTSLKHLRISFYGSMNHREYNKLPSKLVSDGIISRLGLKELGIFVYPGDRRWTSSASGITKEISCLKLSALYFHFPEVESLKCFVHVSQSWKDRDVTTFNFIVGHDFKRIVSLVSNDAELLYNEGQRCLRFVNGENIPDVVVEVLTRATSLYLDHHLSIRYLSQFGYECFDGLKCCILRDCPGLVEIVNNEEDGREFLPVLEYLSMNYLWNLERLWVGHAAVGSLAKLRCLSVHACPKLRYILTSSMLDILSNLEELVIEDCVSLNYVVIADDDVEKIMQVDAVGEVGGMRNLSSASTKENVKPEQFISRGYPALRNLKVLKLHYLPEICGIWRARWPPLEYMSFYNCPKLRNLEMKGNDDVHIKEIVADKAWWDSLEWEDLVLSRRLHKLVNQIHIDEL